MPSSKDASVIDFNKNIIMAEYMEQKQLDASMRMNAIYKAMPTLLLMCATGLRSGLKKGELNQDMIVKKLKEFKEDYNSFIGQMNQVRNDMIDVMEFFGKKYVIEKIELLH
jgi:hypothetical protein